MDSIQAWLPPHDGILPKWLLFVCISTVRNCDPKLISNQVSIVSVANSMQAYATLAYTQKVYLGPKSPGKTPSTSNSPVTPLSARTFGTWTLLSSVIRLYAAYHISNPQMYQTAFWTYAIAFLHFNAEWLYFGTARLGPGLAGPLCVSTGSLTWMWLQWGYYLK